MSPTDIDTEVSRVGSREIKELERYLRGLEVIANLSPLLGLLGTVLGMIKAFSKLESAGTKVDPTILAGGIWEALRRTCGADSGRYRICNGRCRKLHEAGE